MASKSQKLLQYLTFAKNRGLQVKRLDFTHVKKVKFTFDPFHERAASIRDLIFQMHVPKRRETNHGCAFKVDVRSDRCLPVMDVEFADGQKVVYTTDKLGIADVLAHFNELCDAKEAAKESQKKR